MSTELKTVATVSSILGEVAVVRLGDYTTRKGDEFVLRSEAQAAVDAARAETERMREGLQNYINATNFRAACLAANAPPEKMNFANDEFWRAHDAAVNITTPGETNGR